MVQEVRCRMLGAGGWVWEVGCGRLSVAGCVRGGWVREVECGRLGAEVECTWAPSGGQGWVLEVRCMRLGA